MKMQQSTPPKTAAVQTRTVEPIGSLESPKTFGGLMKIDNLDKTQASMIWVPTGHPMSFADCCDWLTSNCPFNQCPN